MKKVLLSIFLTLLPLLASAETVEIDGIWYNLVPKAQEAEVTQNPNKYKGDVEIPASVTYEGIIYSVTSIGEDAFHSCGNLTSVIIPESVTIIKNEAFYRCSNLTSVNIPHSVKSIGEGIFGGVFQNCGSLKNIEIPNGVTSMGGNIFWGCTNLESISLPNSLNSIGPCAFRYCTSLKSIIIPNSVNTIDYCAFEGCTSLASVILSNDLKKISSDTFKDCSELTSITIPASVTNIENGALSRCEKLTDVYCEHENVSSTNNEKDLYADPNAFEESYPQYMTLHVLDSSIDAYRSTAPWSQFNAIVALEDGDIPKIGKCATPEINYSNGKIFFSCETEGVDFISEVTVADAKKYYDSEFTLSQTYKITVYATKAGFENSDVATREIVIENGQSSLFGDLNKDGKVNVVDHVELTKIIMNQE